MRSAAPSALPTTFISERAASAKPATNVSTECATSRACAPQPRPVARTNKRCVLLNATISAPGAHQMDSHVYKDALVCRATRESMDSVKMHFSVRSYHRYALDRMRSKAHVPPNATKRARFSRLVLYPQDAPPLVSAPLASRGSTESA